MSAVTVRARTDGDIDACERLSRVVHDLDGYPPRRADHLREFVAAPGAIGAWVAESVGDIVGHVALMPDSSPEVVALAGEVTGLRPDELAVVARLLVAPAHRRRGLGRALLANAAEAAMLRSRRPILDVATHFDAAIRLYQGAGWVCVGQVTVRLLGCEPLDEFIFLGPPNLIAAS